MQVLKLYDHRQDLFCYNQRFGYLFYSNVLDPGGCNASYNLRDDKQN